ncbi:MAG: hypothetical protein IJW65_03760, partial [Clostridia bacterium]|nr:hypothetical protein [Clostridia bacterium]
MNGNIKKKLGSLVIFRNIIKLPVIQSLIRLDETDKADATALIYTYGDFLATLMREGTDLSKYLLCAVLEDENIYTAYRISNKGEDALYEDMLDRELAIITQISKYDDADVRA